jgi:hypothetical protein
LQEGSKPRRGGKALKAAILGATISLHPVPSPVRDRSWEGGPVRWPRRDPEPVLKSVTRLNGRRLSSLATLGAAALGWLCFVCWPVRDPDLKSTAFDDVMAGMPGFADYALAVAAGALMLAFCNTAYAAFYWPRRVRINRSGQYMTWEDERAVNLAASPVFAASIVFCSVLYLWLTGRLGAGA